MAKGYKRMLSLPDTASNKNNSVFSIFTPQGGAKLSTVLNRQKHSIT